MDSVLIARARRLNSADFVEAVPDSGPATFATSPRRALIISPDDIYLAIVLSCVLFLPSPTDIDERDKRSPATQRRSQRVVNKATSADDIEMELILLISDAFIHNDVVLVLEFTNFPYVNVT